MITAVALPTIIANLVAANPDRPGETAFSELRRASWIINGYLLAYVVAMPLAGRLADVWGARRLFLGALGIFVVGSLLAGRGQSIDELILGRIIQGIGGGVPVPVGTAAASHLFEGHDRPRALGVVGALTFLGMAAGPFLGAAILGGLNVEGGLAALNIDPDSTLHHALSPAWRWVFYFNVPIGSAALLVAWAASAGWETPRRHGGVDVVGAIVWSLALAAGLGAVTLLGSRSEPGGPDPVFVSGVLGLVAVGATLVTIVRGVRRPDPFLDPTLFRSPVFSSAAMVSLLTGYAFATAIIGGAVAVLTAFGSTTIDHLYDQLFAVPDGWKQVIPVELRNRPLKDGLVVDALERWAAGQASQILVGLFVVAGIVVVVAIPPGLVLGSRPRMLAGESAPPGVAGDGGPPEPDGSHHLLRGPLLG